jgi:hypothetical protein
MAKVDAEVLKTKELTPGKTDFPSVKVPDDATHVEMVLDRSEFKGYPDTSVAEFALELSQDSGVTWLPWGAATTTLLEVAALESTFRTALAGTANPERLIRGAVTLNDTVVTALKLTFDDDPLPEFSPPDVPHSVAFDATATISGSGVTSLTTGSFTIGSGANRAAIIGLSHSGNGGSSFSGSCGGVSAALITGTDSGINVACRSQMWRVIAPASGSQTASMSWSVNQSGRLGVVTAIGVDQTTPANNGTFATASSGTTRSLSITSVSGDLTLDTAVSSAGALSAPTQTQRWSGSTGAGSTGPGTGTTTHTWTCPDNYSAQSGANFNQASAAAVTRSYGYIIG